MKARAKRAWLRVAAECPLRIVWFLHAAGKYVHLRRACDGKVLCVEVPPPEGEAVPPHPPSPAQEEANEAG
jgi:hypothetical protein